jgi:hypothetical protein
MINISIYRLKISFISKFIVNLGILLSIIIPLECQAQQVSEYEAKSAFMLKITPFIEWPENSLKQNSNFTICILGEDPIESILSNKIKTSEYKIKNKTVIVKRISNAKEAIGSQILFISSTERYDLSKIIKTIKSYPILTIGDTEGYTERGIMINMYIEGSIKFNVNKLSAEESGIYISSKLLAHAENVIK